MRYALLFLAILLLVGAGTSHWLIAGALGATTVAVGLYAEWYRSMRKRLPEMGKVRAALSEVGLLAAGIVGSIALVIVIGVSWSMEQDQPAAVARRAQDAQQQAIQNEAKQKQAVIDQVASQKAAADAQAAKEAAKEAVVAKAAPAYCKNHTQTEVSFTSGGEGWPTSKGNGFTTEECRTIISKLYDLDPRKEAMDTVAEGKIFIGMDMMPLVYSLGLPSKINYSDYGSGKTQQRVYDRGGYHYLYIYTGTDGKVTSYQQG